MFVVTFYVLVVFLLCAIHAEDNSTAAKTENVTILPTEATIQRKIELNVGSNTGDGVKNVSITSTEFKPSPQLETVYEYNKNPVVPAVGEAKSALNAGEALSQPNSRSFFWPISDMFSNRPATTTESSTWTRRVVFPQTTVETTRDRPYPFVTTAVSHYSAPTSSGYGAPDNPRGYGYGPSKWDQFEGGGATKRPMIMHKTHFESYGPPEPTPNGVATISPVKKIIGLLAALVPIGLLISALTPSVIQVVPMNVT